MIETGYEFSKFGELIARPSGVEQLMEDLGNAMAGGGEVQMLGGGQPAHIPAVDQVWRRRVAEMLDAGDEIERAVGNYEPPQGNGQFLELLAKLLRETVGWQVGPENLAVTAGGQTAFFMLFNILAGEFAGGRRKQVVLPFVPEYIGYANQGAAQGLFRSERPKIELRGDHEFKYRVDFDRLDLDENSAAMCVSRPTNPTGNVLTDGEVERLMRLAGERQIPLILDGAYGVPFPGVFFCDVTPYWDENVIVTMSLSKIGLPGTRTGIVVARPEIAAAVRSATANIGLANPNIGQAILRPLIEDGSIISLCREHVVPFYRERSLLAQKWIAETFHDSLPYRVHVSEGALFLWLWFDQLPITTEELYQRLKARGVLIVPGKHFFFGLPESDQWPHRDQCLRMTFTMDADTVQKGIAVIAEEVHKAYAQG